jgi:hypothetical protein
MTTRMTDEGVLGRIGRLVDEEKQLDIQGKMTDSQRDRLNSIGTELDGCWDLLRQRRALREFGRDSATAQMRPSRVVANYKG